MRKPERCYRTALAAIPAPGTGGKSHKAIFRAACYGVEAELSDAEIFSGVRAAIPPGTKTVSDSAIREAIRSARKHTSPDRARQAGNPPVYRPISPPHQTKAQMIADALNTPAGAEAVQEGITTREGE